VVVNDSLVLTDFINRARREDGMSVEEAVVQSGVQRFRPVLLTSLTTFFGLVPILLERSLQAQFIIPMATSLAFGILFATVITLFLIPILYLMLFNVRERFRRRRARASVPVPA
jgi:multidrug efflux pump subunit AcrB